MNTNSKFKVIIAWTAFVVLTAILVVFLVIKLNDSKTYDEYSDIKGSLLIKDIAGQKDDSYYVFIYSSSGKYQSWKQEELEKPVMTYFSFVHKNKDNENVLPIYGYDVDKFKANYEYSSCEAYLNELNANLEIANTPILVLVSGGIVTTVYSNVGGSNGIEGILVNAMKGVDGK